MFKGKKSKETLSTGKENELKAHELSEVRKESRDTLRRYEHSQLVFTPVNRIGTFLQ